MRASILDTDYFQSSFDIVKKRIFEIRHKRQKQAANCTWNYCADHEACLVAQIHTDIHTAGLRHHPLSNPCTLTSPNIGLPLAH